MNGWRNWLIGALFTIVVLGGGYLVRESAARIERLEMQTLRIDEEQKRHTPAIGQLQVELKVRLEALEQRVSRMDDKLDRLLAHQQRPRP